MLCSISKPSRSLFYLAVNPLSNAWEELEEELAQEEEIKLTDVIVCENIEGEIKLTKEQGDGTTMMERSTSWSKAT